MKTREITVDEKKYFYKFTQEGCKPIHGCGEYLTPTDDGPGEWHPKVSELKICGSGYHVCETRNIFPYINQELYIVEVRGNHVADWDKLSFEEMRFIRHVDVWNEKTARLFACDCAEHVLHIYEKCYPDDKRPREAIEVVRKWIRGEVDAAARAAAWAAARDAAWAAEHDWQVRRFLEYVNGEISHA